MKIYKIARSSEILDALEGAIRYSLEGADPKTGYKGLAEQSDLELIHKSMKMPIGVLQEYASLEMQGRNMKFEGDLVRIRVWYEIWSGEYNGYGVGKPKDVPVYRGFVMASRPTPWPDSENVGTMEEIYGDFAKLLPKEEVDMAKIGEFSKITGNPIEVANRIKSIIDHWGNDDDFDVDDITPDVPVTDVSLDPQGAVPVSSV